MCLDEFVLVSVNLHYILYGRSIFLEVCYPLLDSDEGLETWFDGSRSRLSKVSVSRFKGLGLAREGGKLKIEAWKKHSVGGIDSNIPSESMMFFM